jgi:hypothetical protein
VSPKSSERTRGIHRSYPGLRTEEMKPMEPVFRPTRARTRSVAPPEIRAIIRPGGGCGTQHIRRIVQQPLQRDRIGIAILAQFNELIHHSR